jgi:hypothetical protein
MAASRTSDKGGCFRGFALSMFEVKTHNYRTDLPFYALPYRTRSGAIMFPCHVHGFYMRDHVIVAYKHYDTFMSAKRLMDYSLYRDGPEVEIVRAWIFRPLTDFKPASEICLPLVCRRDYSRNAKATYRSCVNSAGRYCSFRYGRYLFNRRIRHTYSRREKARRMGNAERR